MSSPDIPSAPPRVATVLAAGLATRFGGPKLAAPLGGRPLLAWPVAAALEAGMDRVLLVTGPGESGPAALLPPDPRLEVVSNPRPTDGLGASLAVAARRAAELSAVCLVVLLGDQPFHQPEVIRRTAELAAASPGAVAAAWSGERLGHPVAWGAAYLPELAALTGDTGGREILARVGERVARVAAPPESAWDVDRPGDLARAARFLADQPPAAPGRLVGALGLTRPGLVSLVGSGGKTTLLFGLGRELAAAGEKVVVTTTTRILAPEPEQAQGPWYWEGRRPAPAEVLARATGRPPWCLANSLDPPNKLRGLSAEDARFLAGLPDLWTISEADGAGTRPLKGWATHEPVLAGVESLVVVLAGGRGLGRPLGADWVHRPGEFAAATGLALGRPVTPAAVLAVLLSSRGPLRDTPARARRVLVLNQLDEAPPDLAREFLARARESGAFDLVLAGGLARGELREDWSG
ncbi:MAG: putative selenium-dependent hydroxylase accessory protein YqeC [Deltaproteobacteria bacterium]|nr:putative selenium-dependent hydroxylase accessory protein YqeC [Deltaproteobacteria bacterium]